MSRVCVDVLNGSAEELWIVWIRFEMENVALSAHCKRFERDKSSEIGTNFALDERARLLAHVILAACLNVMTAAWREHSITISSATA
jgi:hypothetical protein